jgi:hypothetical protein
LKKRVRYQKNGNNTVKDKNTTTEKHALTKLPFKTPQKQSQYYSFLNLPKDLANTSSLLKPTTNTQ